MTQHENILFVDVPEEACDFKIDLYTFCYLSHKWADYYTKRYLGPGSYQFIALHSQMTEEKAREVVNNLFERSYRNYELPEDHPGWGGPYVYDTALESYYSFCRHLGLVGEQAVLKKESN